MFLATILSNNQFIKIGLLLECHQYEDLYLEVKSNAKTNYDRVVIYPKEFIISNNSFKLKRDIIFNKPKSYWGKIQYIGIFNDKGDLLMTRELPYIYEIGKDISDLKISNFEISLIK